MSFLTNSKKAAAAADDEGLSGSGIGEQINFLNEKNHIFINKLNYICKNYDQSFKDVSIVKTGCRNLSVNLISAFLLGRSHETPS